MLWYINEERGHFFVVVANDAVIFGVVWGCNNKAMNPLITDDVLLVQSHTQVVGLSIAESLSAFGAEG